MNNEFTGINPDALEELNGVQQRVCPSCGRCPHCGHKAAPEYPWYPPNYWPVSPSWPYVGDWPPGTVTSYG